MHPGAMARSEFPVLVACFLSFIVLIIQTIYEVFKLNKRAIIINAVALICCVVFWVLAMSGGPAVLYAT